MLTFSKLKTYQKFDGDIDGFSRACHGIDSSGISDDDWRTIDELRQALFLVSSGQASADFGQRVERRLHDVTADEQTRQLMRDLAR
jgi:hypothetical protein